MSLSVLLVILALLYLLSALMLRHFALKGLQCTRSFLKPAVFEGEESEMIEIVRNDRPVIIPWLRVESGVSPYIRLGRQENLDVSDHTHYCSLFMLMPYQQIRRRHKVKFLRRGAYNLGNASLTAGDLFGLAEAHREQAMSVPVLVYPRLLDESELPRPLEQMMNEVVANRRLLQDPFLIRGIRPYQIGDPVRDIHWPATARTGEAQLRLHDYSAQSRLLVVLNVQRKDNQWGDRLMDYEEAEIEREISMAATLCVRAIQNGFCAGFAANMPIGEDTACAFVEPAAGAAAQEHLLSAFARLRLRRTLSFTTFLQQLGEHTGLDMLILSCYDSEEIQLAMLKLRQNGSQASLYLVKGGGA